MEAFAAVTGGQREQLAVKLQPAANHDRRLERLIE
jgi:hypothetical protein